jgi:hypothetical protein
MSSRITDNPLKRNIHLFSLYEQTPATPSGVKGIFAFGVVFEYHAIFLSDGAIRVIRAFIFYHSLIMVEALTI